jgi:hypothetical protein
VYWSSENPNVHVDTAVNLPGLSVWCGVSSRGVVGPLFFEGTVTGAAYLNMLQEDIVPAVRQLYGVEDMWYQQDGALPLYHRDVRAYLGNIFPDRWIERRGSVEYPPRLPDLTAPDCFLWCYLKDAVYSKTPATLQELRQEIERFCAAVPAGTLVAACQPVTHRRQLYHEPNGGHFEHLH